MSFLAFLAERRAELFALLSQHVVLVLVATLVASAVGVPLGIRLARSPSLARPVLAAAGVAQTVPSLALFGLLIPLPFLGVGPRTAVVALVLYALLPILRNTVVGLQSVDPVLREAALGLGMTEAQRLRMVDLPLALPVVLAGLRIAVVLTVGTATIAAAVGAGGLGAYIFRGIATVDARLLLAGAIPAALLALLADGLLGRVERSPRPARAAAALVGGSVLLLSVAGAAAHRVHERPIVVGSKNFTEQLVLGELLAAHLEARGFPVERRLNLGGTALCHAAVRSGAIDVYVEYTGTALLDVLKRPPSSDPRGVLDEVRRGYEALGLVVGRPLGFDNSFALVVRPAAAAAGLRRISDLAERAATVRLGLFGEFLEREDGLPGLQRAYGLRFQTAPTEMDLGLLYEALRHDRVDVVVGSATDGLIAVHGLVVLEDDRRYFPPYEAVPVLNARRAAAEPGLGHAVDELAGRIDAAAMRRMNHAVDGEHRSPAAVAREFLAGP
ncbi:MAG TPA: ABC transporter permease/substrate-binding protein [Vicinamibacteria bacterium]|nr:ABC transporter permease/substrate-binding protein [Vicinamibacteria bacterium]